VSDSAHTIIYAATLGLVCAVLLTGVAELTRPYAESNRAAERIRNVFGVLGVEYNEAAASQELVDLYGQYVESKTIREETLGGLPLYVYAPPDVDASKHSRAVEFAGQGLWGPIKGFLALDAELTTIKGITFHEQTETPGLGAEIAGEAFRSQFVGKRIADAAGAPGIRIVRDGADADNEVDAITSATMTCDKVQAMLNDVIARIMKERDRHGR